MTRLILASRSVGRRAILEAAGVAFESVPTDIDESAIKKTLSGDHTTSENIALALATAKADAIAIDDALVIGCDQILTLDDGTLLSKPASREDACAQLALLSGRTHRLVSAVALQSSGEIAWSHVDSATLAVRNLSDGFITEYVARNWMTISRTVGCYEIEGAGAQLFDRVEGDYFTVIGLPLLPLLAELRRREIMPS